MAKTDMTNEINATIKERFENTSISFVKFTSASVMESIFDSRSFIRRFHSWRAEI